MDAIDIDPETLPTVFPVQTCSRVLGIGKNETYALIAAGEYPVRVLKIGKNRFRVSRYDLLEYLHPSQPAGQAAAGGAA